MSWLGGLQVGEDKIGQSGGARRWKALNCLQARAFKEEAPLK